ncbi:TIM barrel protein [Devosia rhodophyticola]|uniref:TIM barrel protein n=1 Tax=Devosia rhodophyticola TaxID=3026423 RepID=A0ABY7YTZ8_9HYPH|nr:TIM barrel protein [Devosia rhodophyticola]WDR04784.1 TIM barrel protein [Devosia rhodophyticola]
MTIKIANAPCSWGIEFADAPGNPPWRKVLQDCAEAGYKGIELGPVGYMPEEPEILGSALDDFGLELVAGVVFRPFHDPNAWDEVRDAAVRTCEALSAHGAQHLVLIDSISPRRAPTAGRASQAEQMGQAEWTAYRDRFASIARLGTEEYGLKVSVHAHAAGFMDFEPELERLLDEVDEGILKICLDTGHQSYAGFDPVAFLDQHISRVSYMHFKDIDPNVKLDVIANRTGFYDACGQGIFCNLGKGDVDFPAVRDILLKNNFEGWCTVEQDCDPLGGTLPVKDAEANRQYLESIGFN